MDGWFESGLVADNNSVAKIITTSSWHDGGGTRAQLGEAVRTGALIRLRRGVVADAAGADPTALHRLRIEAAAPLLGPDTVFGHESGAVLHKLPLLAPRLEEVIAVRTAGSHGAIAPNLHTRRGSYEAADLTVVDGLPVTTLDRTVADLIRRLPFPEAVMVADAGVRAGLQKSALLNRTAKGRGCRMARAAVDFADARSESAGESLSRVRILRTGVSAPRLQEKVFDLVGRFLGRVDFWWDEAGVAGEFDGIQKYVKFLEPGQRPEDVIRAEKRREQELIAAGVRVLRWGWSDLWDGTLEVRLKSMLSRTPVPNAERAFRTSGFAEGYGTGAGPRRDR